MFKLKLKSCPQQFKCPYNLQLPPGKVEQDNAMQFVRDLYIM